MSARMPYTNRRRRSVPVWVCGSIASFGIALTVACSASSTTSLEPTVDKCAVTSSAPADPLAATGGPVSLAISAFPECAWTAATQASWITGLTPTAGQGNGQIRFTVVSNPADSARHAEILVNDVTVRLMQAPASSPPPPSAPTPAPAPQPSPSPPPSQPPPAPQPAPPVTCTFGVAPLTYAAAAAGASAVAIAVTAPAGCAWTSASGAPWLTVVNGATGTGAGTTTFAVAGNTSAARTGTITVAGRTVTVTQAGGCTFSVTPALFDLNDKSKKNLTVRVSTGAACPWAAVSQDSWITVTSGATGTGGGTTIFDVTANLGFSRTGRLTVAGTTVTVRQDGWLILP